VKRQTATEQVEYVLDDKYVLQEARGDLSLHPPYRRYHYGYGPLAVVDSGASRFISTDALGSTTDLTTATGAVASGHQYDAWGQYRNGTAPSASEPKLGFTGHQFDPETGLVYARARYYDPEVGIFISRDSYEGNLSEAPSLHRFAYAWGNPLIATDPSGHLTIFQPPNQDLIKQEMEIRWQQYQSADSPEAKVQALQMYRHWQGQLRERQDNDIFAEEVTTPMAVAGWTSAALGPVAAEYVVVKAGLTVLGVTSGISEVREGQKQGGQLGRARVVAGVATVLSSAAAMLPEGIKALKWVKARLSQTTTVVESKTAPGTVSVNRPAPGLVPVTQGGQAKAPPPSAGGAHPGRQAAESPLVSEESVIRALRRSGSVEGAATAKAIRRGVVDLQLVSTDPFGGGAAGRAPWGTNRALVALDKVSSPQQAAGVAAHEAKHVLQGITPSTYRLRHEVEAYAWQRAVQPNLWLQTDADVWNFVFTSPLYRGVPPSVVQGESQ
jgi:RHS repeat-associated protein